MIEIFNDFCSRFSYGAGHYTQVVWAESEELGCGMVYYKGSSFWETLVVCNYAVAGNLQGNPYHITVLLGVLSEKRAL